MSKMYKVAAFIQLSWRISEMKPICFLHVTLAHSECPLWSITLHQENDPPDAG